MDRETEAEMFREIAETHAKYIAGLEAANQRFAQERLEAYAVYTNARRDIIAKYDALVESHAKGS